MITVDGTFGEGGGQILRSALALSLVTGKRFCINKIRGRRKHPGLLRQHLTAVRAATTIGGASVTGAELGSSSLSFEPTGLFPGRHHFDVGSAGSAGLVLQAVLPALLTAPAGSHLQIEGGTHNPWAPPFEFLQRAFLPLVARMGPQVTIELVRPGFYPAGGGCYRVQVGPTPALKPLVLDSRGKLLGRRALVLHAQLPRHVADRERRVILRRHGWQQDMVEVCELTSSRGPGNAVVIELECAHLCEVVTAFGARGVRAEKVADAALDQAEQLLEAEVAVDAHLADQLLLPFALAGGGSFTTTTPTLHTTTNIEVIRSFLEVEVDICQLGENLFRISVKRSPLTGESAAGDPLRHDA
jgi:RNA 3'-terminal phosphate cyclase (ATP)